MTYKYFVKIYFAGCVRSHLSKESDVPSSSDLIVILRTHGEVVSELAFDPSVDPLDLGRDSDVFERDLEWLNSSDVLIAEISHPSHGVGWEIAYAQFVLKIPILLLWRVTDGHVPSAMLRGNWYPTMITYDLTTDISQVVGDYLGKLPKCSDNV